MSAPVARTMHREALRHVLQARNDGADHHTLAELYEGLKVQIEAAEVGWRAIRGACTDGSHLFRGVGAGALVLVITPACVIMTGSLYPGGLIDPTGIEHYPDRGWLFPPPDPRAPGTKVL